MKYSFFGTCSNDYKELLGCLDSIIEQTVIPKEIILSTGMAEMREIYDAVKVLKKNTKLKKINLLHCVSLYPTNINELNLLSIKYLKSKFKLNIGLSDHTTSIVVPSLAVSIGAKIIEKHITLNKKLQGPDHFMSLNPSEFKQMVDLIRKCELSLGKFQKKPSFKEKKFVYTQENR